MRSEVVLVDVVYWWSEYRRANHSHKQRGRPTPPLEYKQDKGGIRITFTNYDLTKRLILKILEKSCKRLDQEITA